MGCRFGTTYNARATRPTGPPAAIRDKAKFICPKLIPQPQLKSAANRKNLKMQAQTFAEKLAEGSGSGRWADDSRGRLMP
jgi:hypothetical protein